MPAAASPGLDTLLSRLRALAPLVEDEAAAATTNAYEAAAEAASFAFRAGGGAVLFRSGRLQRCFRDIQAGAQHIVVSDESYERAAQLWLGVGEPQML